jgi:hypothetical protein
MILFSCPFCNQVFGIETNDLDSDMLCPTCQEAVAIPPTPLARGFLYGDFVLTKKITAWEHGQIYVAYQISLDRNVAVKLLTPKAALLPEILNKFLKEARDDAKIEEPHAGQVFMAGQQDGVYYYAMEHVNLDADTNSKMLSRNHILTDTCTIARKMAVAAEPKIDIDKNLENPVIDEPAIEEPVYQEEVVAEPPVEEEVVYDNSHIVDEDDLSFLVDEVVEEQHTPVQEEAVYEAPVQEEAPVDPTLQLEDEFPVIRPKRAQIVSKSTQKKATSSSSKKKTTSKSISKTGLSIKKQSRGGTNSTGKTQFKIKKMKKAKLKV